MRCLLLVLCLAMAQGIPTPSMYYDRNVTLVEDNTYILYWSIKNTTAIFETHVKTLGYVGFGLSMTGGMKYADIVTGWVKDGQVYFQDRYSVRNGQPELDFDQNWMIMEGREQEGYTILKFSRNLTNCDPFDFDITDETMRIIYAYHPNDPEDSDSLVYHGRSNRGTKSLYLIKHETAASTVMPSDATYLDLRNQNVSVPSKDTTYWCSGIKIPTMEKKHHVFKVEPFVQQGHEKLVHHFVAYACYGEINDTFDGLQGDCDEDGVMKEFCQMCYGALFVWAVGGETFYLPEDIGIPFGGEGSITYLRLEMHYDNPGRVSGLVDSSGLRIWMTPTLRKYDAWSFSSGVAVNKYHIIPPGFDSLKNYGYCANECIQSALKSNSIPAITVFGVFLHSHLLGVAMKLRHFRDGIELPPLATEEFYDFNYQNMKILKDPRKIYANDALIVECDYKTSQLKNVTYGGESTREEMCLAFVLYYPQLSDFNVCFSLMLPSQTLAYVNATIKYTGTGAEQFTITGPPAIAGKKWIQVIEGTDWTNKTTRDSFQAVITNNKQEMVHVCDSMPSYVFRTTPNIRKPYYSYDCKGLRVSGATHTTATHVILLVTLAFYTIWT